MFPMFPQHLSSFCRLWVEPERLHSWRVEGVLERAKRTRSPGSPQRHKRCTHPKCPSLGNHSIDSPLRHVFLNYKLEQSGESWSTSNILKTNQVSRVSFTKPIQTKVTSAQYNEFIKFWDWLLQLLSGCIWLTARATLCVLERSWEDAFCNTLQHLRLTCFCTKVHTIIIWNQTIEFQSKRYKFKIQAIDMDLIFQPKR